MNTNKPRTLWHLASKVAGILKLGDGFKGTVKVADTLVSDRRHPFIGVGVEGSGGRVYLAMGNVDRYQPKDKATKALTGPAVLSWSYNGSTWIPIHGHEPTAALADIAAVVSALQSITAEDITTAQQRATGDSDAPRTTAKVRLADLMG